MVACKATTGFTARTMLTCTSPQLLTMLQLCTILHLLRITIPCHEAAGNIIADIANKDNHDPKDGPKDGLKELTDRQKVIVEMIIANPFVNERTIERDIAKLKKLGVLTREGGRKEGKWVIKTNDNN